MFEALRALLSRRELLYMITWREIRIRYKQSVMGFMWALLLPAVIVTAGIIVRFGMSSLSGLPISTDTIAGVSVKALVWAFFSSTMRFASMSLIGNSNLVTKIYMPREIFPIAAVLSQLVDLGIALFVLAVGLLIAGYGPSVQLLWAPLLLAVVVALTIGWALFISAACLFFRDVKYLVEVVLTFAIFITPVFYSVDLFGKWANTLLLNPMAPLLEGLEKCIVQQHMPDLYWTSYSIAFAAVSVVGGFYLFKRWEPAFAESI